MAAVGAGVSARVYEQATISYTPCSAKIMAVGPAQPSWPFWAALQPPPTPAHQLGLALRSTGGAGLVAGLESGCMEGGAARRRTNLQAGLAGNVLHLFGGRSPGWHTRAVRTRESCKAVWRGTLLSWSGSRSTCDACWPRVYRPPNHPQSSSRARYIAVTRGELAESADEV